MLSTLLRKRVYNRSNASERIKEASAMFKSGDKDGAIAAFRQGAERFAKHRGQFFREAASLLMTTGDWFLAREFWIEAAYNLGKQKGEGATRQSAFCMLNSATCSYLLRDPKGAAIDMVTSLTLDRSVRKTREYLLLGSRLIKPFEAEQAVGMLTKAARIYPDDHALNFDAAELLLKMKRYDEGLVYAQRAYELNGEDGPSRHLLYECESKASVTTVA